MLHTKHLRLLEILPPTESNKYVVKRRGNHQSHEPPMDSGEAHQHGIGVEERDGGRKLKEMEGGGLAEADQDAKK